MWSKYISKGCLDLLFPPVCPVCNAPVMDKLNCSLCDDCMKGVRLVEAPLCSICGMEIYAQSNGNHICGDCLTKRPPFDCARSFFHYDQEIRILISNLKYKKDTSVIKALRSLIRGCDLQLYDECDYVIPVPLHRKRVQQRGFNQALLLAKACFGDKDVRILLTALQRTVNTVPQVSLDAKTRRNSLKNVFRVNPQIDISGRAICLIDDVYTTGTTVSECSSALLAGGAARVLVLTLARVEVPHRGRV